LLRCEPWNWLGPGAWWDGELGLAPCPHPAPPHIVPWQHCGFVVVVASGVASWVAFLRALSKTVPTNHPSMVEMAVALWRYGMPEAIC